MVSGILLVDKPAGITSHDLVARARRALGTRKVGHAGTLDPMATGLLLLGVGASTRLLTYLVGLEKDYAATIRLGVRTTTDDADGDPTATADASAVTEDALERAVAALTGDIVQVPSAVSAIKVDGRRAYERVRAGEQVELRARPVTVSRFELRARRPGAPADSAVLDLDAVVTVSSGTYVRALARDLGDALGVGGHLTALRRTRVGPFRVEDAGELATEALLPPAEVAARLFPVARLDAATAADVAHGRRAAIPVDDAPVVAAVDPTGRLIGLVAVAGGRGRVLSNFPPEEASA